MKRFPISVVLAVLIAPTVIVQAQQSNAADRLFNAARAAEAKGDSAADDNGDVGPKARGFYQTALKGYGQALDLYRAAGDRSGQLDTLLAAGDLSFEIDNYEAAIDAYTQALPLQKKASDRAETLTYLGEACYYLKRHAEALGWYRQALPLITNNDDRGDLLIDMADAYSALGRKAEALDFYLKALPLQGDADDRTDLLNTIGDAYFAVGNNSEALDSYSKALTGSQRLRDRDLQEKIYNNIGLVYSRRGQNELAIRNFSDSLKISRELNDSWGEAIALDNTGDIYVNRGEMRRALKLYGQSLKISVEKKARRREALVLTGIGLAYSRLGDKHKALEFYEQARAIAVSLGDKRTQGTLLNNIGLIYNSLGERQKAIDYYSQSLTLRKETGFRDGVAVTLNNIGLVFDELGDTDKALDTYESALQIKRDIEDRRGEAVTLANIAMVYSERGQKDKAIEYLAEALPIHRAVGDRLGEALALRNLSRQYPASHPEATFFAKQAVNTMQSVRTSNEGLDSDAKKKFEESIEGFYRHLAGLLAAQGRFGEAEEVLNLLKNEETADFIRRDGVSDKLKKVVLTPSEQAAVAEYEKNMAQSVAITRTQTPGNAKAATNANLVLQTYLRNIERSFPVTSSLSARAQDVRRGSERIQRALQQLGPGTVAIYTLVQPDSYTAIVTTADGHQGYVTSIPEKDLNQLAFNLRKALQDPGSNPTAAAEKLYKVMFPESMRADLDAMGVKTILWALDGTLRYVPVSALYDGQRYLVSVYGNAVITPDTDHTDKPPVSMKGLGFGVSEPHEGFPQLPGAKKELERIFNGPAAPVTPALTPNESVLLDRRFSKKTFTDLMTARTAPLVHIATHFNSRPGVASESALLLGDGPYNLADIESVSGLFGGVDLLTFSACSTAFEQGLADGHEVDSLGTIAQDLGAKTVIASLWSVNDDATASLMEAMYRVRKEKSSGKLESLRQAQLLLASGQLKATARASGQRSLVPALAGGPQGWQHPYYWAAFILIGNTR